jgi:hypothetical protein
MTVWVTPVPVGVDVAVVVDGGGVDEAAGADDIPNLAWHTDRETSGEPQPHEPRMNLL